MELEKRTNGCVNPVHEKYCRRTSNFLLINRVKTNVPVRFSGESVGNSVDSFVLYLVHAKNNAWYINLNIISGKNLDTRYYF